MEELREEIVKLQKEITALSQGVQKLDDIIKQPQQQAKIKRDLPPYDGVSSWHLYLLKFEAVALLNGWDNYEKACELMLRLPSEGPCDTLVFWPEAILRNYQKMKRDLSAIFSH